MGIDKDALVNSEVINSVFEGLPIAIKDITQSLLHKHGILNLDSGIWHSLNSFINVISELEDIYGSGSLYEIGKAILNTAIIPPDIKTLKEAFNNYSLAYSTNHKNSKCIFEIKKYKKWKKSIIVKISNPYPLEVSRGLLTSICWEYPPKKNTLPEVCIKQDESNYPLGIFEITW